LYDQHAESRRPHGDILDKSKVVVLVRAVQSAAEGLPGRVLVR
jgi:hypothetical protein